MVVGVAAVATGEGPFVGASSHGMVVIAIIHVYGSVSGAHINPAVTAAQFITGHIDYSRAMSYVIAQFGGGIAAALLLDALKVTVAAGQTIGSDLFPRQRHLSSSDL